MKLKAETPKRFLKIPILRLLALIIYLILIFPSFSFLFVIVSDVKVPRDTYLKMETKMSLFLYF